MVRRSKKLPLIVAAVTMPILAIVTILSSTSNNNEVVEAPVATPSAIIIETPEVNIFTYSGFESTPTAGATREILLNYKKQYVYSLQTMMELKANEIREAELKRAEEERQAEERMKAIVEEKRRQAEIQKKIDEVTAYVYSTESVWEGKFTRTTDLKNIRQVTIDDMNYIIDTMLAGRESKLAGCGEAFIKVSQETGLNPVFLLCLSAQEAGWVVSDIHAKKCNAYSICMLDDDVEKGFVMGDTYSEGIINGGIWIYENYYQDNQHTLYDFIYGSKCYSSSKDTWIDNIVFNINRCYGLLDDRENNL